MVPSSVFLLELSEACGCTILPSSAFEKEYLRTATIYESATKALRQPEEGLHSQVQILYDNAYGLPMDSGAWFLLEDVLKFGKGGH